MKYYSETLEKLFDSVETLEAEENKVAAEKKAKEEKIAQLKAQREDRAKEVEEAFKLAAKTAAEAQDLLSAFIKDYGAYHTTFKHVEPTSLFNFWNLF